MKYKQTPPYCVSVCLSTGCNLQCDFCGINAVQINGADTKSFMTISTATKIAKGIAAAGWNSRIEFGAYGESTLNPNWIEIISIFREHNPKNQIMILTNGGPLLIGDPTENILKFFRAGGTKMGLEHYNHVKIFEKISKKLDLKKIKAEGIEVRNYPEDKLGNPHLKDKKRVLIMVRDLTDNSSGTHSTIINMAGSAAPLNFKRQEQRCAHPFRKIIFRSTGEVPICCNDWMGEFKIGNINEEPDIEKIWLSKPFVAARHFLFNGMRSELRPCYGCDAMTYRNGLLPDGRGKTKLPKPTSAMRKIVKDATSGGPSKKLTKSVLVNVVEQLPEKLKAPWNKMKKLNPKRKNKK